MENMVFCPNCQMNVEAVKTATSPPLFHCSICGTLVQGEGSAPTDTDISLDEISFVDEFTSIPGLDQVLIAGYTPSVRELLVQKMTEQHIARTITPLDSGEEMIIRVINNLAGTNGAGKVELVVTDVPMPFLNGINAAIGLRALERTYLEHDLIPILFLTNKPCDDTFKKVIRFLAPAKYATLGPVDDREKFIRHLSRILGLVAREKW